MKSAPPASAPRRAGSSPPSRARGHEEYYFVEELAFVDADSLLSMLRERGPT
ncbi:hypothetical protein [Streptomyces syringium]|uniref:hypothetical protein n=1 Tax=Streptomyces syringium TaxID=76729 RepID=UPI0034540B22